MTTAFTIWLAFVQLLGPWLCCCPPMPPAARAVAPSQSAPAACSRCCKPPAPAKPAKPVPLPAKSCPCLDLHQVAEAGALRTPSAVEELGAADFGTAWANAQAFDAFVGRADAVPPAEWRPPNAASLPPGTRLWVHHALRL